MARARPTAHDDTPWSASGFVRLGRWRGAPLLFHWSIPLGLYLLGGMRVMPGFWLAASALILAHELGHAALATRYGARVVAVKVMPIGGLCEYEGDLTELERSKVAWGGVLVQAVVYGITALALRTLGSPSHPWASQAVSALTEGNAFLLALNLLPAPPLDGAEAWKLPLRWIQRVAQRAETEKVKRQAQRLRAKGPRVTLDAPPPPDAVAPLDEAAVRDAARDLVQKMWSAARDPSRPDE